MRRWQEPQLTQKLPQVESLLHVTRHPSIVLDSEKGECLFEGVQSVS